jgi:hypothetical protein
MCTKIRQGYRAVWPLSTVLFLLEMRLRNDGYGSLCQDRGSRRKTGGARTVDRPDKDPILKKAINAKKVMTVHQGLTTGKADYGTVGFQKGVATQILIFPKSLERFADVRVTGVKYDLLDSASVPKGQEAPKIVPAKRVAKGKRQEGRRPEIKIRATPERSPVEENTAATVVKFPNPAEDDANAPTAAFEGEEIIKQVRLAMDALEEGKQVAAFNLLKRIVDR